MKPPAKPLEPAVAAARAAQRGRLVPTLLKAARLVNEEAIARVNRAAGRVALRQSHTNLFPHIDFEHGTRLTDLARRLNVSKQAVGQLVEELEGEGLLERVADPDDKRARRVRFTARGMQAMQHGLSVLAGLEAELVARLGKSRAAALLAGLEIVVAALDAGPEPG
jgi:DNA-binding MarR family transcriptional regulator